MRSAVALGLVVLAGCQEKSRDKLTPVTEISQAATEAAANSPGIHPSAPLVPPPPGNGKQFKALGTEPFWSIEVLPGMLRYSTPENIDGITFASNEAKEGKGVRLSGKMQGKIVSLFIEPGTCSDGMSDTTYEWTAKLTIDGQTEQGCAIPK